MSLVNSAAFEDLVNLVRSIPSDEQIGRRVTESSNYASYHAQINENEYLIEVPLVGILKNELTVDVQENVLTIVAKTNSKSRFVRNFKQSWNLTKDVDTNNVSASLENGLLTVRAPRVKPTKKVVNVNVV